MKKLPYIAIWGIAVLSAITIINKVQYLDQIGEALAHQGDVYKQQDSVGRRFRTMEIVSKMDWLDSLKNDRTKLCLAVGRHFESLEGELDVPGNRYEAADKKAEPGSVDFFVLSARFLRYDCFDVLGKLTVGEHWKEFQSYDRAARLVYVLDHLH